MEFISVDISIVFWVDAASRLYFFTISLGEVGFFGDI
jgi:hypothetical protein